MGDSRATARVSMHRWGAFLLMLSLPSTHSFATISQTTRSVRSMSPALSILGTFTSTPHLLTNNNIIQSRQTSNTRLYAKEDDNTTNPTQFFSDSESTLLGVAGIIASAIMIYSESVLFQTGCGLPAGPLGLVGAAEGVSYLGVVGLVGFSLFTKIRTGNGLPAGPGGILGAAEGLAYLALLAGLLVLVAQVTNYGYIPNAVPMEGGMCK